MKQVTIKLFFLLLTFASCDFSGNKHVSIKQFEIDSSVYVLNLDTVPESEQSVNLSSIFPKVKTIILETTKESVIGRVRWLQVFDDRIFIMDDNRAHGIVLSFDMNGKFLRTIGRIGAGPDEYMYAKDFTIDPVKKEIHILYSDRHINRYTLDGAFVGTTIFKSHARYIQYHNGKIYTDMSHFTDSVEKECLLQEIDPETGEQTGQFLNIGEYNNGWNEPYFTSSGCGFMAKLSESPKFLHLFTYVIPELNQNTVKPAIVLQSQHLATRSDVEQTKKVESESFKRLFALRRSNKITLDLLNYAETKNHIFLKYWNEKGSLRGMTIDRKTKFIKTALYFNDILYVDEFHKYSNINMTYLLYPHYVFSTQEGVYECMDAGVAHFAPFFENLVSGENMNPNLDRLDELKKLPEDTNPVIFYYSYE